MSRLEEAGEVLWTRVKDAASDAKTSYEDASIFGRWRLLVAAVVLADVLLTAGGVWLLSGGPGAEVWFEEGFPSNMLILRNYDASPLRDVRIVLDGRFVHEVEEIAGDATIGFELDREFRDEAGHPPDDDYRPRSVQLQHRRRTVTLRLPSPP
jgi:hypothetical protein